MGRSLSASIVYGIRMGGSEEGYKGLKTDPETCGCIWPDWTELDNEDPDYPAPEDFITQCQDRLLQVLGGWDTPRPPVYAKEFDADWDRYYETRSEARKRCNIDNGTGSLDYVLYGISDYTEWILGYELVDGDECTSFESRIISDRLQEGLTDHQWDRTLEQAVKALGLEFEGSDGQPLLWLTASYF